MEYENEKIKRVVLYSMLIVFIGSVLANIMIWRGQDISMFYLPYSDYDSVNAISGKGIMIYVLLERTKQFLIIFLIYKVAPKTLVFRMITTSLLFVFGFVISCQMYFLGLTGVVWLILCLFPHYIIYILLIYNLFRYKEIGTDQRQRVLYIGVLVLYFVLGVVSESIFSRILIKNFLQYI